MKAYFLQRLISYLIDFFIVIVVVSCITFFIPVSNSYDEALKKSNEVSNAYLNGEIDSHEYLVEYGKANYTMAKENMIVTVINLLITVAYFGTYAYYKNGQTIGKKLMHIKVESLDGRNPSHATFIFRALFIYGVIASIISLIILQLIQADMYSYTVLVVETIQSILVFISALMIMFRKDTRGLHDLIFKTKVVAVK